MAWFTRDSRDDGYVTVAAAMIALALGITAVAGVGLAITALKQAQRDLGRTRTEFALAGAQAGAVGPLLMQEPARRLRWRAESDAGPIDVLAEVEAAKLSLAVAAVLDDAALGKLGVADPERLRARLLFLAGRKDAAALELGDLDPAPLWRACAGSLISPHGRGKRLELTEAVEPGAGQTPSPPGQVWRIRIVEPSGWTEERLIRLTGDEDHPAAVIERRLSKTRAPLEPCRALIE